VALARQHVVEADAAGAQPHQHLAAGELFRAAVTLKDDHLHGSLAMAEPLALVANLWHR